MKLLLSVVLGCLAVVAWGAAGLLASLALPPGAAPSLVPASIMVGLGLVIAAVLATGGDLWALVARNDRPPPKDGPAADYYEEP
jgi:hypothetical protein